VGGFPGARSGCLVFCGGMPIYSPGLRPPTPALSFLLPRRMYSHFYTSNTTSFFKHFVFHYRDFDCLLPGIICPSPDLLASSLIGPTCERHLHRIGVGGGGCGRSCTMSVVQLDVISPYSTSSMHAPLLGLAAGSRKRKGSADPTDRPRTGPATAAARGNAVRSGITVRPPSSRGAAPAVLPKNSGSRYELVCVVGNLTITLRT